ncbi:MAG TPA: M14 family zinc carboxypeptidase [Lysobacter sp.]|nr:M14 family zinc carboxypeptidase [Lysobacter sp.]
MRPRHLALAILLAVSGTAQAARDGDVLVYVTISYRDLAQLQSIASRFQHLIVDERAKTVQTEASREDIDALRRAGIRVEIDEAKTSHMRETELAMQQDVGIESISGYPCYRTVEETYATMDALASAHPNLARVVDIGPSWLRSGNPNAGYRMRVLRLTNAATDVAIPTKADMVVLGSIHAREYTPAEVLTRFGEWLVAGYGANSEATWLLDNFRFHLILQSNPDGRKRAESGLSWRKNVNTSNGTCSANFYGVDLNRNFPYFWNGPQGGSSGNPCASTYRGPAASSEPETENLLRYIAGTPDANGLYGGGVFPDRRGNATTGAAPANYRGMFVDLHSAARLVLWPWAFQSAAPPNRTALRTLGRRMAWFNDYSPRQWTGLYIADGTTTDTVYGLLGAPSYTIEMGEEFFESCPVFEGSTLPDNLAALRYAARNLQSPYVFPGGPDTTAIGVSLVRVTAGTPVTVSATVDDGRFNQSNGAEPVHAIASARAYLNQRPWLAGATSTVLSANDGAFDESAEIVSGTVATTGLGIGRHVVYVRGTDASGRAGTPQATHFTVAGIRTVANGADISIPDNGTVDGTIGVGGIQGTAPEALRVDVDIRHADIGDLVVDLIAPRGTVYRLHQRSGAGTVNLISAYVRDASSETANGTWRLRVSDQAGGNTGFINRWSLRFEY